MHLPFLRELHVGANRLAGIPAWPWLPSLTELHLQDNQLTQLACMEASGVVAVAWGCCWSLLLVLWRLVAVPRACRCCR